MKWFKHLSTARNDEKIAALEDKAGLEGYGFYFKMLEIVSETIDYSNKCEVTYSISRWGRQTNISTKKFLFLVQCCSDVGLMFSQRCGDNMIVKIPKLLNHRDNHTKNLQVTCKQEEYKEYKEEVNKEVNKNILSSSQAQLDGMSDDCVQTERGSVVEAKHNNAKTSGVTRKQNPAVIDIFDYWRVTMSHERSQLDPKREKIIVDALKLYPLETLKTAILGCSLTPFNMGINDRNERYDGIHLIFKPENIDRFIVNAATKNAIPITKQAGQETPRRKVI